MQKHMTREEAAANAQLESAADAVAAAIQFVRTVADEHAAHRPKSPLELRFGAEKKAAVVDDAITSVAENTAAEYVQQIARGEGPAQRQQFSLGNHLTWNPARALPQFLHEGKPILLTDPEQLSRWDRQAKQEAIENAPGRMAQLFKVQSKPAPRSISAELERSAEGKIVFQSADRLGWDKVIYYHAGEKRAAEYLAEILRNNSKLTEQQQAEAWRLEGWPEADITRELERIRNVQRMHDESWWTPAPSLMDRARQHTKSLLSFRRVKKVAPPPAKAEPQQARQLLREIQQAPELVAKLPQSAPFSVGGHPETDEFDARTELPLRANALVPVKSPAFPRSSPHPMARSNLDRHRANGERKVPAGLSPNDEPILRWLDAAMEDVHRLTHRPRRTSI
jgi:hypothetical protein